MIKKINDHGKLRASRSLARLWADDLSSGQAEAVNPWQADDPEYRREMLASLHLMADLEGLEGDDELLALVDADPEQRSVKRKSTHGFMLVAGVILAMTAGWWAKQQMEPASSADIYRYVTRIGEVKSVELTDGSVLSLNTGTELLVTMTDTLRKITLVRGEAFFDVERDESRPFSIDTGTHTVTVLGTEFDVRKFPEQLYVAVTEGVVVIHPTEQEPSDNAPLLADAQQQNGKSLLADYTQVRVSAGWQVQLDPLQREIEGRVNENDVAGWRSGFLEFYRAPLYQVVAELNRYSGKKILIEDSSVMGLDVSAAFNIGRIDQALKGLESSLPLKVTHFFDRVVITGMGE